MAPKAEHQHRLSSEQPRLGTPGRPIPGAIRNLVAIRRQQLAPEREHHREHMLGTGVGKHARRIRQRRAPRPEINP